MLEQALAVYRCSVMSRNALTQIHAGCHRDEDELRPRALRGGGGAGRRHGVLTPSSRRRCQQTAADQSDKRSCPGANVAPKHWSAFQRGDGGTADEGQRGSIEHPDRQTDRQTDRQQLGFIIQHMDAGSSPHLWPPRIPDMT
ncbi:hypothetical protein EYF80_035306 [Liparis tanakae]|uniref:Uncharacterized protein n=1 Tax=Liparis tanakae TaxID=230148 RepID=A0A4Z2GLJ2_9TELE|nr:hypothetical protein EYF80_035306 [Liparis tanakae]